jgi:hypothetical protein
VVSPNVNGSKRFEIGMWYSNGFLKGTTDYKVMTSVRSLKAVFIDLLKYFQFFVIIYGKICFIRPY